jgi:hypothetical protein
MVGFDARNWLNQQLTYMSPEEKAAAELLFNNQTFATRLSTDAVPQSTFNSELDRQRNQFETRIKDIEGYNLQWQNFYETDLKPKVELADRLTAAGLDPQQFGANRQGDAVDQYGNVVTKDELANLAAQRERDRTGLLDWSTFIADKAVEYREEFGKRFPAGEFRKFATENSNKYATLDQAFLDFSATDRQAKVEADRKTWEAEKEKEIESKLRSQLAVPVQPGSGDGGSPFHTVKDTAVNASGNTRDDNRKAFAEKWSGKDFSVTT